MEKKYEQFLLAAGAAVAIILLVINVQLTFSNTRQLYDHAGAVLQTREVMAGLENLLSLVKDAETGQRGYVITGEDRYLEPYRASLDAINGQFARLQALTGDNERQQARLPSVRADLDKKLAELALTVDLRRNRGFDAAQQVVKAGSGKNLMDMLRASVGIMLAEEQHLLEVRSAQAQRTYWWAIVTGLISGALALIGVAAFAVMLQRHLNAKAKAAAALHEQRELLRITLASIGDAIIATDTAGRVTYLNAVAESLTGWTQAQAAGQPLETVFNIVNETTRARVENPAARALREGIIVGLANHTVLLARDGRERPIDDSASPIRNQENEIVGCVLVFRDVTERRDAEERLRRSEERFDLAVKGSNEGVWDWNIATGEVYFSERSLALLGYAPHEAATAAKLWRKDFHDDDFERVRSLLQRHLREGVPYDVEFRKRDSKGEFRWFRSRGQALRDAAGVPVRMAGSVADITDRKVLEEQIRQRVEQLADGDRRKDEFLATLAHELRNPLAPLSNALAILKAGASDPQTFQKTREMMERQLGQMVRLIDDLLDVSRISRGKIELRLERVDLASVINQALEICKPLSEKAAHRLEVDLPDQPVYIEADMVRLAQVFCNLLSNAFKFTPAGGHIRLSARRDGGHVVVALRDSGVGIPDDKLSAIFELFTQLDSSLERSQGGLGIGLTLVQRLVAMHGGVVVAQSDGLGKGAEFVVRLPVAADQGAPPAQGGHAAVTGRNAQRHRILVVDDNQDSANSLSLLLRLGGNQVETAHDGVEALELAERFRPHMILLDIGMPRLNGYDAARRIREQPWGSDVVLVALTGWGQEEDRRRSREAGFDEHLVKPVDHDVLVELLTRGRIERPRE